MFGFLIHDEGLFSASGVVCACHALRTYNYQNTEHMGSIRIHFFRNASVNSYFASDEGYTVCVAGTLIFNNVHGSRAVGQLLDALHSGRELRELFDQFRGPYTLVQVDRVRRQVSVLNSREGLRNCFLATRNGLRAYSTNLLLMAALTEAAPSAEGIRQFIHIGATMEGNTIFENIERLSAASLHTYCNERWTTSRLWQLKTFRPDRGVTRENATKTLIDSFVRNFEFSASIDSGRVAADLTGGTDSRTVLCCLMEKHPKPVASTGGPADFKDVRIARRIADKLGIEHYWYQPESTQMTEQGIARAVELADGNLDPIRLAKRLPDYDEKARRFDLITGGLGGLLFKDQLWLYEFNRVGFNREPHWDRIAKFSLVAHSIRDDFFSGFGVQIIEKLADLFRQHSAAVNGTNNQKLDYVYFDLKAPAMNARDVSLTTQFLDIFHPMMDGDNVQYSINLPPQVRIRNILEFGIIQSLRPELSWITTDMGLPAIAPLGMYSWLRILRGRRYIEAAIRKMRSALLGSSGQGPNRSRDIEQLRTLGYFDLLEHSALAFAPMVSSSKLAEFKHSPAKLVSQYYLIGTLSVQLFFERVKELMDATKKVSKGAIQRELRSGPTTR